MFFSSLIVVAQIDVKGRVIDAETKEVLVGASVIIKGIFGILILHHEILKRQNMKQILIILFLISISVNSFAQNAVKVEYNYHYYNRSGKEINKPMILTASHEKSKFYNPDTNRIDSMCNTPEGKAQVEAYNNSIPHTFENLSKLITRLEKMYVEKNRNDNEMKEYDTVAGEDRYYYTETLGEMSWEISDSTFNVLGYECIMAETDYHGRHWNVWFAPEIPISDGPWKLHGLPGLILKAKADAGQYEFTATAIENYGKEIEPVYEKGLYEVIDRKELLRTKQLIYGNMAGYISAQTGTNHPKNMKSLQIKKEFDYLETDYR